jgi:hypothetical protein
MSSSALANRTGSTADGALLTLTSGAVLAAVDLGLAVLGILRSADWGWVTPKPGAPSLLGISPTVWFVLGGRLGRRRAPHAPNSQQSPDRSGQQRHVRLEHSEEAGLGTRPLITQYRPPPGQPRRGNHSRWVSRPGGTAV